MYTVQGNGPYIDSDKSIAVFKRGTQFRENYSLER